MEEIKKDEETKEENTGTETAETADKPEDIEKAREELKDKIRRLQEERNRKMKEGNEAVAEGKGRLKLDVPFKVGDQEIEELVYDFMTMKGNEYTDAMGSDPMAFNAMRITPRQALALFAKSASKHTEGVDMTDIIENIGMTDSVEAVQVATLFFNASTQAGRMRISKK